MSLTRYVREIIRPQPDGTPWTTPLCDRPIPYIRGTDQVYPRPMTVGCSHCQQTHEFVDAFNAFVWRMAKLEWESDAEKKRLARQQSEVGA